MKCPKNLVQILGYFYEVSATELSRLYLVRRADISYLLTLIDCHGLAF